MFVITGVRYIGFVSIHFTISFAIPGTLFIEGLVTSVFHCTLVVGTFRLKRSYFKDAFTDQKVRTTLFNIINRHTGNYSSQTFSTLNGRTQRSSTDSKVRTSL